MAITLKQKEQFIELRSEGKSFDTISKELKISKPTLINLQDELDKEISNAKFLKIEAIIEKYKYGKKAKIESYLKQLEKINKEIENRDLSEINFKDLLSFKESIENNLKSELDRIRFLTGKYDSDWGVELSNERQINLD